MDKYVYENITWGDLKALDGNSIDKTFELLCADFMKIKFNLDRVPLPSQNESYPGIEGETIEKDDISYGYQSKHGDDAFAKDKGFEKSLSVVADSISKSVYKLNILCLFSKKDYPTKNRSVRDDYFKDFETNNNLNIQRFFGNDFISEIRQEQYYIILHKYFPKSEIKQAIYAKSRENGDVCEIKLKDETDNVANGFVGDSKLYETDLNIATLIQKEYSYRKLAYSSKLFILDQFEKLEDFIAEKTFSRLGFYEYTSLDDYLQRGIGFIDGDNDIANIYGNELKHMISSKEGIFVNYGTQKKSSLNYLESEKIKFINKKDGKDI